MSEGSIPFDEFEHPGESGPKPRRGPAGRWMRTILRAISFVALWVALATATGVLLAHVAPLIHGLRWAIAVKSGIPLIAIGVSYISLIFTLARPPAQVLVGFLMGLAFVLWGTEQFLTNRPLIAFIDDCVVFLFVVDLSIVIRHNFREHAGAKR
jgi:hypothetical protein